jgi:hypothetical protein
MAINNIPAFADNFNVFIYIPASGRFQKQKWLIYHEHSSFVFVFWGAPATVHIHVSHFSHQP